MTAPEATPALDPADRAFLGHPKGLGYLAFTEAFERFSYYSMQTLLVLYMVKYLLLPGHIEDIVGLDAMRWRYGDLSGQPLASRIFGDYTALVYLTPIFGGWIADRFLGRRLTITIGAITMAVGHFLMAFEASFLLALLCLILGNGCFKGNIASQVGALYRPDDHRRADAFQIFYLAINAGVIAAPLIAGTLGEDVGWHWGFGAAGVGMLIGLALFLLGTPHLAREERARGPRAERPRLERRDWTAVIALILLIPVLAIALLTNQEIFNAYLVWGDRQFDLTFFGRRLPTSWLITLDSAVSVAFLALVALFWRWWGKRHWEPDELGKIVIGSVFTAAGGLCLFAAAYFQPSGGTIGLFWPVAFHVLNSIGFAHILPVSLALFAKVAPKAINATVIGLYYLAFFLGNYTVGWIGGLYSSLPTTTFWLIHVASAVGSGFVFYLFKVFLSHQLEDGKAAPLPA
ncbi:MAG TPA: peptide MFS transporter [Allosphingosinicella sp.]|nr:peptide MFS transporter [Allosphingosinicella sp.]